MIQGLTLSNSADKDTLFSLTVQNHITAHTSVSHLGKMKLHCANPPKPAQQGVA